MFVVKRSDHNPVLEPSGNHYWEASATFNMCAIRKGHNIYGLYRAISSKDSLAVPEQVSTVGVAKSTDGEHFGDRMQLIIPEEEWEKFGCEDPRVTLFEDRYYIFYTALSTFPFSAEGIKVAVAVSDDLKKISEKHLVTPFNAKAMTLFPDRIGGKATLVFSAHTDSPPTKIVIAQADRVEDFWNPKFWDKWHADIEKSSINLARSDNDHIEIGAPPIKTGRGWLLIYSYISNYFQREDGGPHFGIEAALLDLEDPRKVLGRTRGPIIVPESPHELSGHVSNIVFPSGALLDKDILSIYYGAADTTTCLAKVSLQDLVSSIHPDTKDGHHFKRYEGNPIITPNKNHPWESRATFNPAAIDLDGKVHILYRALSEDNTSVIGYAVSTNGRDIDERFSEPIYLPREDFEMKKVDNANSGCEDPRLTKIGERIYMCYTAFNGIGPPRAAITSIKESDFLERKWNWSKPGLLTPQGVDDKDTCIFPKKIGGKYFILHRIGSDICGDYIDSLDFEKEVVNKCIRVFGPRPRGWDSWKVGIAGPPIETDAGWLLLYHSVSERHHIYRIGAVLLDTNDPTTVISRSTDPIFEPEMDYELEGVVSNVVFPCGAVVRNGLIYMYYGGADKIVGLATMKLDILLDSLTRGARL